MITKSIQLPDHQTTVRDSGGDGTPVVLIHALSMEHGMWEFGMFQLLAESQNGTTGGPRRVIAYDIRGHGTAFDAPRIISLIQLATDLRNILYTLSIEKAHIAGVSFGGAIAQIFALTYPKQVCSLALIATTSTGSSIMSDRAMKAETDGMSSLVEPSLSRWFLPLALADNTEVVQYAKRQLAKTRTENWAAAWRTMASIDCLKQLGEIVLPVLFLASKNDTSTPPTVMHKMSAMCRHGEYREVGDGMHLFVMESPRMAAQELIAFWARTDKEYPIYRFE